MSRRMPDQQLLEKIDAVLSECGNDPRRRPPSRPARPAWRRPDWLLDEWAAHARSTDDTEPEAS